MRRKIVRSIIFRHRVKTLNRYYYGWSCKPSFALSPGALWVPQTIDMCVRDCSTTFVQLLCAKPRPFISCSSLFQDHGSWISGTDYSHILSVVTEHICCRWLLTGDCTKALQVTWRFEVRAAGSAKFSDFQLVPRWNDFHVLQEVSNCWWHPRWPYHLRNKAVRIML